MAYQLSNQYQSSVVIRRPFSFERPILWRAHSVYDVNELDKYRPHYKKTEYVPEPSKISSNFYENFCREYYRATPLSPPNRFRSRYNYGDDYSDGRNGSSSIRTASSNGYSSSYGSGGELSNYYSSGLSSSYRPKNYDSYSNSLGLPSSSYLKPVDNYSTDRHWPTTNYWDRRIANRMRLARNRNYESLGDRLINGIYPTSRFTSRL